MSAAYKALSTSENIALVRNYGCQPIDANGPIPRKSCTQCSQCDRWQHDSRILFTGGGGEEPEYDAVCLKCAVEWCTSMENYDWEADMYREEFLQERHSVLLAERNNSTRSEL